MVGIPFEITLDGNEPNQQTMDALREAERIAEDPNVHGEHDVCQLFDNILS